MDHSHPADHTHGTFIHLECLARIKLFTRVSKKKLCDLCRCDLIGLVVLREGSSSYDSDCSQRQNTVANVAGIIAGVAVLAAACGAVAFIYNRRNRKRKAQQGQDIHVSYEIIVI